MQANGDLTVNQTTVNELPDSIQNMFIELLKPSVEQIGKNLKEEISSNVSNSIGMKIRTVLEDGFVRSIKEQIKSHNLNYHIEMVFKKIHDNDNKNQRTKEEIHETLNKTDLFLEWIESAESISPQDSVLSKIWENWLYSLSRGRDNPNHKILLDKMKQLTPEDADVLLRNRRNSLIRPGNQLSDDGKLGYISKKLSDMGLIKRFYFFELFTFISSLVAIWVLFNVPSPVTANTEFNTQFQLPLYALSLLFPTFFYIKRPFYRLTWIGSEIVSYSNQTIYRFDRESFKKLNTEGVPKEILNKIRTITYNVYYTKTEFIETILNHINKDQFEDYKDIFFKYLTSSID